MSVPLLPERCPDIKCAEVCDGRKNNRNWSVSGQPGGDGPGPDLQHPASSQRRESASVSVQDVSDFDLCRRHPDQLCLLSRPNPNQLLRLILTGHLRVQRLYESVGGEVCVLQYSLSFWTVYV